MERELTDEEQRIQELFREANLLNFEHGLRRALGSELSDESIQAVHRIRNEMQHSIADLVYRYYVRGFALGLITAGRPDLAAQHIDVEKAVAVIMAEDLTREDNNDT